MTSRVIRILSIAVMCLLGAWHAVAQTLPSLTEAEFVRKSFVRNHYNLRIPYAHINLQGTHLFLSDANNLVVQQRGSHDVMFSQIGNRLLANAGEASGEAWVRCSDFHPFLCYEVEMDSVTGEQGMVFYNESEEQGDYVIVYKRRGTIGIRTMHETKEVKDHHTGALTLRCQWTGTRLHVFACDERSDSLALSYKPNIKGRNREGQWDERQLDAWNYGAYVRVGNGNTASLRRIDASLACGTGQADPSVVQHTDGTPYIKDGKLYVMLTTRGFEQIPDSHQGIYRLDLTTFQWELCGALFFTRQGDHILHPYHATKAVWDEANSRWLVMTVSHGEDHCLMQGNTQADILHGLHTMDVAPLDEPYRATRTNEDPDFQYDAQQQQWLLAYVSVIGQKGYQTILATSPQWNGTYTEVAHSEVGNETGTRLIHVGGERFVLSGGDSYNILSYPTLQRIGGLQAHYPDGGFRGWASVTPIPWNDGQRWLWITFDRGRPYGRYSYGSLYVFLSKLTQ